ncbi:MAG: tol-pal system protein YbgF [Pseudomonadota bacterium]
MIAHLRLLTVLSVLSVLPALALAATSGGAEEDRLSGQIPLPGYAVQSKPPVLLAQVDDTTYRMGQLEERIRVLNGRLEEMNFMMLQMQEQMRQMREDNEFRFQELEGGTNRTQAAPQPDANGGDAMAGSQQQGEPARSGTLGTITFDQSGELVGDDGAATDQTQTASLPASGPDQLYDAAYGYVLSGDYPQAEQAFNDYLSRYPGDARVPDAYFWLGEAQYLQGAYHEAAKTLLAAHKQYPSAEKAPEMLLKLGMSLAALDNRDTACATYREVLTRYPGSSDAVRSRVAVEQSRMSC